MQKIDYQIENNLDPEEFRQCLIASTLGERRPIDDFERIKMMIDHANLIVTARHEGKLVGVSRSLTDFTFTCYCSDLAVDENYQSLGIGKELIRQTKLACGKAVLHLQAAPKAVPYYPKIGMTQYEFCYRLNDVNDLK